ncbi:putative nuclease HARBI1 [Lytechinus pictus]|uniref:putative nuclease HARBI1 n=1 Tax=Lytechinus pictus TaxID=7653 RepID=UPI0030B9C358
MAALLYAIQQAAVLRRERVFRDRTHPLDIYDDSEMLKFYRFSRQGCVHIINRLAPYIEHPTRRNSAIPASLQVFITLRYFATGSMLTNTSIIHGISISTASRTVRRVTLALYQLRNEVIKFPQSIEDLRERQVGFYGVAHFPNVVGAVDGTHVNLLGAPLGEDEYLYVNRKGRKSLNVQLICDHTYKLLNVVARWPGSTHDSRILRNSAIGQRFDDGELQGILLGDAGYRLEPWLMTPVREPHNNAERAYNRAHCKTRVFIEQVNGQLKNKFRCLLGGGINMSPERASDIIIACCVLFNISKELKEPEQEYHMEVDEDVNPHEPEGNEPTGAAVRQAIINDYFA